MLFPMSTSSASRDPRSGAATRVPAGTDPDRCPSCAARRTGGAPWCGQCHHPFEQPATVTAQVVTPAPTTDWDERHRQAGQALDEAQRQARADEVMARLASASVTTRQGSRLIAFAATAVGKVALIGGGTAVLLGLGLLTMWAVGQFL